MQRPAEKSEEFFNLIVDWQAMENETIDYASKEIPKAHNPLIKTMLKVLKLEAEKHCAIQQMIVESLKKEAVHLSPDELETLSGHFNRHLGGEDKVLSLADAAFKKSEPFIPRYLLSYLISDMKKQNGLLRQFDDELKTASIPTSVTSKISSKDGK